MTERAATFSTFELNEKLVLQKAEVETNDSSSNEESTAYNQVSQSWLIVLFCYHVSFNLESELKLEESQERTQEQVIFANEKFTTYSNWLQSFDLSLTSQATSVNHFKLSIIYSSNDRSRTSRWLKKQTQFVENFYSDWISYIQVIEKQLENNDFVSRSLQSIKS